MFIKNPYKNILNDFCGGYSSSAFRAANVTSNANSCSCLIDTYNRQISEHYDKVNKSKDIKLIRSKKTLLITSI